MSRSQVCSVESMNGPIVSIPALFTRMSIGPSSASTRATASRTLAPSAMSTPTPRVRAPCSLPITAAVDSAASSERSAMATAAPAAARAEPIAAPIPRADPVTSAVPAGQPHADLPCSLAATRVAPRCFEKEYN